MHERMSLTRQFTPFGGQHLIFDFTKLDFILSVTGIVYRIRPGIFGIDVGIMQSRPDLAGKKKGSGHSYGADGIQFVGIEQHLCFDCGRFVLIAKAMGAYTVNDILLLFF